MSKLRLFKVKPVSRLHSLVHFSLSLLVLHPVPCIFFQAAGIHLLHLFYNYHYSTGKPKNKYAGKTKVAPVSATRKREKKATAAITKEVSKSMFAFEEFLLEREELSDEEDEIARDNEIEEEYDNSYEEEDSEEEESEEEQ